jgi:hypothetical protein
LPKFLTWLLGVILVVLLGWALFQGKTGDARFPSTPTAADFKLNIPQKALWRNYLIVSAEAASGTDCRLIYVPPSGVVKVMEVTADASGLCEWRWKIEEADGKGSGRLIFTVDGVSETHFIEIRSAF